MFAITEWLGAVLVLSALLAVMWVFITMKE
jgi:hypothetical protein